MMDLYECPKKHAFLRAAVGQEELIPCAYCESFARFVATVDERAIGGNKQGARSELPAAEAAEA
ncbi:MAG: hypothetical protein QMD95_02780 [Candidatus Hodarchaeaceae archaeon]|nr:hypothetical protein [Candidatus Hodarchaeaceae archaeon]